MKKDEFFKQWIESITGLTYEEWAKRVIETEAW